MAKDELTKRQRAILRFIERHLAKEGFPPSLSEIAASLGGVQISAIAAHLQRIERKGFIKRKPGLSRSITILRGAANGAVVSRSTKRRAVKK